MLTKYFIVAIIAYTIGNVSPAIVLGRLEGVDIKEEGSGNAGTTNVLRVLGGKQALITLLIDVCKGMLAVYIGFEITDFLGAEICFLAVVIGHVFPVAYGFQGGKGVATAFGAALMIDWPSAFACLFIVVLVLLVGRKMSLASICGIIAYPFFVLYFLPEHFPVAFEFAVVLAVFIIFNHRANIQRLIHGEEDNVDFSKLFKKSGDTEAAETTEVPETVEETEITEVDETIEETEATEIEATEAAETTEVSETVEETEVIEVDETIEETEATEIEAIEAAETTEVPETVEETEITEVDETIEEIEATEIEATEIAEEPEFVEAVEETEVAEEIEETEETEITETAEDAKEGEAGETLEEVEMPEETEVSETGVCEATVANGSLETESKNLPVDFYLDEEEIELSEEDKKNIAVLGCGSFGSAIGNLLSHNGHNVTIYGRNSDVINRMRECNESERYFPGVLLNSRIEYTSDLEKAASDKDIVVFAVPAQQFRNVAKSASSVLSRDTVVVNLAKGVERESLMTMSDIAAQEIGDNPYVCLSGPSHAEEVVRNMPTTVVVASDDKCVAELIQDVFMRSRFRVYTSDDVKGVELGGAIKNVIAIATGVGDGMSMGDNARAALMTRGISEIKKLGVAMGAKEETFSGLSGIGDLMVTCASDLSRNRRFGILLGQGLTAEEALSKIGTTVEGVYTVEAAIGLAEKYDVEMPITEAVAAILNGEMSAEDAVSGLMGRDKKEENA